MAGWDDDGGWDWEHEVEQITATIDDDGRVHLTVELEDGGVMELGGHGGFDPDYIADLMDEYGDAWADYLASIVWESAYGE